MLVEIFLGICALLLLLWMVFKKPSGLPPGKWGYPVLGYIPTDGKYITQQIEDLHKKYGDIYVWKFGSMVQVFVHDYSICKQIFAGQDFVNRPDLESLKLDQEETLGIAGSNGAIWHNNRRFTLRQLRDLGMGKSSMVSSIQEQAEILVDAIKECTGKEEPITHVINVAVLNIIWKMVADKQFGVDDPKHKELQELIRLSNITFEWSSFADMFSFLKYMMPNSVFRKWFKLDLANDTNEKFLKFLGEVIEEHLENLDPEAPKDLIDAYLIEMKENKTEPGAVRSYDDLKFLTFDLFFAGSDTTSNTLEFLCIYMAAFPDVQKKLQEEIDEVLPKGIIASADDKIKMPYTEAVINEVLRKSSLANIGVHHSTVADTMVAGYKIPKGALITSASAAIHHDERYWDKPDRFIPERWINSEGKFVMIKEGYLPFGTGKRACIGEGMARMEIFILATAIFQNFNIAPPEGKQIDLLPDHSIMFGHNARRQDVIFTHR